MTGCYRGYTICYEPGPGPGLYYTYVHVDYDGAPYETGGQSMDKRCGWVRTYEAAVAAIDELEDE